MAQILIIDDSNADRALYGAWLGSYFTVLEADTIAGALAHCETQSVDLVIVDFLLRAEDGFQFLQEFRHVRKATTPVIFYTEHETKEVIEDALELGANGFFAKQDLTKEKLLSAVRALLPAKELIAP